MHWMKKVAMWILVLGGLAWGYEGLMDKDVFEMIGGNNTYVEMAIDLLIGFSALFIGFKMLTCKHHCEGGHHE